MVQKISKPIIQAGALSLFLIFAAGSASTKNVAERNGYDSTKDFISDTATTIASAYEGYTYLGHVQSESEAKELAKSKGYTYWRYNTGTGAAYGK